MTYGNYTVDYEQRAYDPERMRIERLARAHAALNESGLGAMILYSYDSHRYLGYYSGHQYGRRNPHDFVLLIKDGGYPYVPADRSGEEVKRLPWLKERMVLFHQPRVFMAYPPKPEIAESVWDEPAKEVKGLLKKHGVANLPCGIDMPGYHMVEACQKAGIKLVDCNHVMAAARMVKTDDEVECLRMAGVIAESAHWEVCKALRPGVTEWQMAGVVANALYKLGAEDMEGPSFVILSGERTVGTNLMPTDKIIRPGDMFVIDINGVSFQGYRTCFYRTYVVGDKPTEHQKKIYHYTLQGQLALEESIKPGVTMQDLEQIWKEKGKAPGQWGAQPEWPAPGIYYSGVNVHPIGLCSGDIFPSLMDRDWLTASDKSTVTPPLTVERNMTFAVEVGCREWDGKQWSRDSAKLENCGVVTEDGFEVFYRFPLKELIAVGLPGDY